MYTDNGCIIIIMVKRAKEGKNHKTAEHPPEYMHTHVESFNTTSQNTIDDSWHSYISLIISTHAQLFSVHPGSKTL